MKRFILLICFISISLIDYGQIIADHSAVDMYDKIPQQYIDEVKKMLVDIAGESHSSGYRIGQNLLEMVDSRFQVTTYDGTIPSFSDQYLRLGRHDEVGESTFYTTQSAINAYKSLITNQNNAGNPYSVIGFGWCWDMHWTNPPGGTIDPVYNVHWAGSSEGGPEGNRRWGLDSGDEALTGNSVCMDTYLDAVEQYIQHCIDNGISTIIVFTTGPVDNENGTVAATENGFQRELKHDYIRNYVAADNSRILFDYADILCWNNNGVEYISNWNDGGTIRPHANIHPDNMKDYDASWNTISHTEDGDHIGEVGAVRIAKAMWWMLARIAGWDGSPTTGVNNLSGEGSPQFLIEKGPDEIRVKLDDVSLNTTLSVYNLHGSLMAASKANGNLIIFNTSNLAPGIYLVNLSNSRTHQSFKVYIH